MKKYILVFWLTCFSNIVFSQHVECFQRVCYNEISQSLVTSKAVGECLNLLFGLDSTKNDLKNKKVCFVLGPAHNYFSSKESFLQEFENNVKNGIHPFAQLFYLDKHYQNLYNCDAVIVYGHKKYFSSKAIIKMLKNDNSQLLTKEESEYLNLLLLDKTNGFDTIVNNVDGFDFHNKKIYFYSNGIKSKESYFNMQKNHYLNGNLSCDNGDLYILNKEQKESLDDADAIILYWSKFLYSTEDLLKKIKKK